MLAISHKPPTYFHTTNLHSQDIRYNSFDSGHLPPSSLFSPTFNCLQELVVPSAVIRNTLLFRRPEIQPRVLGKRSRSDDESCRDSTSTSTSVTHAKSYSEGREKRTMLERMDDSLAVAGQHLVRRVRKSAISGDDMRPQLQTSCIEMES